MRSSLSWLASERPDPFALAADLLDPPPDEDRDLAIRCSQHLPTLIREAWPVLEPQTPFVSSWHVDCLAEHLDAVTHGQLPRLLVNIPPRTSKSLTTAVLWPCWEWLTAPHIRWLFASYAADLSTRDSVKCRRLIESRGGRETGTIFQRLGYQGVLRLVNDAPWELGPMLYQGDGEPWRLTGDQNAKTRYDTTATGSRLATSVGGVATGEGGDRIVVDDPVNPKQARSEKERLTANEWWDGTMTTRFNNGQATAVIVQQRLHEDDLTGHLLAQGGWHHLCLPAEYEPAHPFTYPDRVTLPERAFNVQAADGTVEVVTVPGGRELPGDPRTLAGELLEPVRLSRERLAELLKGLGSYGYAGQMQQRPAPAEGGILKNAWWRSYTTIATVYASMLTSWDLTFGAGKDSGSFSVGQVWGSTGPDAFLLDEVRGRWDFVDLLEQMRALAAKWPLARPILIENKAAGAPAIATLRREIAGLVAIDPTKDKVARAQSVTPFIESGNVYLPEWALGDPVKKDGGWVGEMAAFPNGAANDRVDAMTQALSRIYQRGDSAAGAVIPVPDARDGAPRRLTADQLRNQRM